MFYNDRRRLEGGSRVEGMCSDEKTREILSYIQKLGISKSHAFREGVKLYAKHGLKNDVSKILDRRFE